MAAPSKVTIVGAGLGGLTAAIACRHGGFDVTILERAPKIGNVGAGIQIPPNSAQTLGRLGVLPQIEKVSTIVESFDMRRYADGSLLASKPYGQASVGLYGGHWRVIHREDYHTILLDEALRLGATLQRDAHVENINVEGTEIAMMDGSTMQADVVIGADGADPIKPSFPTETGDLAYRATFSRSQLEVLNNPRVDELCAKKAVTVWFGPDKHCVFYPIRAGSEFNLVLLRPDNLPHGTRSSEGDISEMRATFDGWDPILTALISCISSVLKWKLMHHEELETWVQGNAALLGDACHPTLPYQAQGAAMAVEDGAVLGNLLSEYKKDLESPDTKLRHCLEPTILHLYEEMRKQRTTLNVAGAEQNRIFYHLNDGPKQQERDAEMANFDFATGRSSYTWLDSEYNKDLLSYDATADAREVYRRRYEDQISQDRQTTIRGDGSMASKPASGHL
ncbi:putative salicylate hydroxylase [Exophiala viscosa]|uniref:Salicylate hydroxylase n=1 Tax=Exophiala viscosa TaxID=2486360 RepID=A0AAN6I8P0_9EURO|nr:putative salicylate hydroxylase [Exophiala viscosa]